MRAASANIMIHLIRFLPVANDFLSMGKGFPARAPLEKKSFLMFISNGEN